MKKVFLIGTIVLCFSNLLVAAEPRPKKLCTADDLECKLFPQEELDRIAQESRKKFADRMAAAGVTFAPSSIFQQPSSDTVGSLISEIATFAPPSSSAASDPDQGALAYFNPDDDLSEDGLPDLDWLGLDLQEETQGDQSRTTTERTSKRLGLSPCIKPIPDENLVSHENKHVIVTNTKGIKCPKDFKCESCGKVFDTRNKYIFHVFRSTITCKLCDTTFLGRSGHTPKHFREQCPSALPKGVTHETLFQSYNDALKAVDGRKNKSS